MTRATASYLENAPPADPPQVWTRSGSRDNLIVLTDRELVVASVAKRQQSDLLARLDLGERAEFVFGPTATIIPLAAIRSLDAPLGRSQLVVDYAVASRKFATHKIHVTNAEMQAQILEQVAERLGSGAQFVRNVRSRVFSAFKPFQVLMAIALLAGGFNYLSVETFGVGTDREIIPQDGRGREFHLIDVQRRMPKVRMIPYAGMAVLAGVAITGTLLATAGYQATITVLAALAGACALWTFARFAFPQVTISVVPDGTSR